MSPDNSYTTNLYESEIWGGGPCKFKNLIVLLSLLTMSKSLDSGTLICNYFVKL